MATAKKPQSAASKKPPEASRSFTREQIDKFEELQAKMRSLYEEMQTLTKKSPNDSVNSFKLRLINSVLATANSFLGSQHRPYPDFEQFVDDELPSNSDVLLMLSQYISCLEKLRADNVRSKYKAWYWVIDGEMSEIQTGPPKKIE